MDVGDGGCCLYVYQMVYIFVFSDFHWDFSMSELVSICLFIVHGMPNVVQWLVCTVFGI